MMIGTTTAKITACIDFVVIPRRFGRTLKMNTATKYVAKLMVHLTVYFEPSRVTHFQ